MADNDKFNDEYQFADLDSVTPQPAEGDVGTQGTTETYENESVMKSRVQPTNVKRNIIITIVIILVLMGLYKIIGSMYAENKVVSEIKQTNLTKMPKPMPSPKPLVPTTPAPIVTVQAPPNNVEQKLSALSLGQESLRSDMSSLNSQLSGINNNLNTMATKIADLNSVIASLSAKLADQSTQIEQLTIKKVERPVHISHKKKVRFVKYFIQAVIPGRAWLISKNGSTLTVREGTVIPGYGMVKLIDPNDGRIITSSGHVIKYSQEDS